LKRITNKPRIQLTKKMNAIQIKMMEGLTQKQIERIERIRKERNASKKPFPYIPDDVWREIKSYITTIDYEKRLTQLKPKIKEFITQKWTTRSVLYHFGQDLMSASYPDAPPLLRRVQFGTLTKRTATQLIFGTEKQRVYWKMDIYPFDLPTDASRQSIAKKMCEFIEPLLKNKIPSHWRKIPYTINY